MTTGIRECPFCGEVIKAQAKKCRFCGEFLEIGLTREAVLAGQTEGEQAKSAPGEGQVESAPGEGQAESAPGATVEAQVQAPQAGDVQEAQEAVTSDEGDAQAAPSPLSELYQKLEQMPDSPEKESAVQMLQQLVAESEKGDEADEGAVEDLVKNVAEVLPDVAEIAINTMINPASGLTTLVQKVAQRVAESQREKAEETETQGT